MSTAPNVRFTIGSKYCLLNACLPVPHGPTASPVLGIFFLLSAHQLPQSCSFLVLCGSRGQPGPGRNENSACTHLSPKLLPSLLSSTAPGGNKNPWALEHSLLGLAHYLSSLHAAQPLEASVSCPSRHFTCLVPVGALIWGPAQDAQLGAKYVILGQVLCRAPHLARNFSSVPCRVELFLTLWTSLPTAGKKP